VKQRTIAREIMLDGIGIHRGQKTFIRLIPAKINSGIVFRRIDLPTRPEIAASYKNLLGTNRGVTLGSPVVSISTVEHLLAALSALGIGNLIVEVDGAELPVFDGSALPIVEAIKAAGIVDLASEAPQIIIKKSFTVKENQSEITVSPYHRFRISFMVDYPKIGVQKFIYEEGIADFASEIAPARTFGYAHEVEALHAKGLGLGASMENALVLDREKGFINSPRFADEPVRHKILDIIGDLSLVGKKIAGEFKASKSSHQLNLVLARKIGEEENESNNA
jgi:UDP-3-O-[3-hydroxymyristoyl] N-acetylglucosamine deacetylase